LTPQQPKSLHPPIEPYETGRLSVSHGHELFYELSGSAVGQPLVFLHGGPGSGASPYARRLFDPKRFKIIQFDQRGCGASTPHGRLQDNTTPHLVADIEALLNHLGIERLHLAGGSWGSTLALAYGIEHPARLRSLLLYGIFLCRPRELRSLYFPGGAAHMFYPELFEAYLALLPEAARANPIEGYRKLFNSEDRAARREALLMWTRLEKAVSRLNVSEQELQQELEDEDFVLSHSLIENHYFRHGCFLDMEEESGPGNHEDGAARPEADAGADADLAGGGAFLRRIGERLADIPTHIINGRYDLVCPPVTAHELHKALPRSTLTLVPATGHSFHAPALTNALIRAAERL